MHVRHCSIKFGSTVQINCKRFETSFTRRHLRCASGEHHTHKRCQISLNAHVQGSRLSSMALQLLAQAASESTKAIALVLTEVQLQVSEFLHAHDVKKNLHLKNG